MKVIFLTLPKKKSDYFMQYIFHKYIKKMLCVFVAKKDNIRKIKAIINCICFYLIYNVKVNLGARTFGSKLMLCKHRNKWTLSILKSSL